MSLGGDISGSSLVTVGTGATFDISGVGAGSTEISTLAGSGTVQVGGNGLVMTNASTEFSGVIADGGSGGGIEIAGGTQTLSGISTYTGWTVIGEGATLALSGAGSIASSAVVVMATTGVGTATLDISQTTSGASVGGLFDVAPGAVVSLGSKTLTLTGDTLFGGVIQDGGIGGGTGGGLTLATGANVLLAGASTYTGATRIEANAILSLEGPGSIAQSSGVNLAGANAVFDISCGCLSPQVIKDLSGVAGSQVLLGDTNLTVGTANSTTFAGVIDNAGGNGGLIKQGSGTLTLTGTNTYLGGTTINAGTIAVSSDANLGDATGGLTFGGGTLQLEASFDLAGTRAVTLNAGGGTIDTSTFSMTVSQGITGPGGLTKAGVGALILTGANTYGGGTTVNAGTLQLGAGGSLAATGALTVNGGTFDLNSNNQTVGALAGTGGTIALGTGTLTVNQGVNTSYAGVIFGDGSLVKQGTGTLTLSGTNTYSGLTGTTTINGGTLQLGDGGTTGSVGTGAITNNAAFVVSRSDNLTMSNTMSGTGSFTKLGTNTLTLTGNVSGLTGTTTIAGGTLQLNNTMVGGNIVNNGTLGLNFGSLQSYSGSISGSGSLTKLGTNTLTLTGANTYSGPTTISGGILQLGDGGTTGSLGGGAIVNNAALAVNRSDDLTIASARARSRSGRRTFGTRHQHADLGQRHADQDRCRHADPRRQQHLLGRHDGDGRHAAGHDDQPAGRHRQQCSGGVRPGHGWHLCRRRVGQRQPDQNRRRQRDPGRHQQLQRRHDGVGRHADRHDVEPAGRHRQQCSGRIRPGDQRHLCGQHVGRGHADQDRQRHGDPDGGQHLWRRHDHLRWHPAARRWRDHRHDRRQRAE